jgi:hypothetical protein
MTLHAEEEMEDDGFTVFDVEEAILTGRIVQRQKDRPTGEWKYVICGRSVDQIPLSIVGKLGSTGKLVLITVFAGEWP